MTLEDIQSAIWNVIALLSEANAELSAAGKDWAERENNYRHRKSVAFLNSEGAMELRRAKVDNVCDKERLEAHLAEARREAAKELVRSRQAELSALQSLLAVYRSEIDFAKYGPRVD